MKTRSKILAFIISAAMVMSFGLAASAQTQTTFTDVPENHPYKAAIDFNFAKGFIVGTSATMFRPDANLTRAQLAVIWCRSMNILVDNHPFTDITKLRNYYDSPAVVLRSLGILSGTGATKFSPESNFTREQLALLTMRTYNLGAEDPEDYKVYTDHALISSWAQNAVSACINAGVFEGLYDKENFMPSTPVTRAEIAKLIYNISTPAHTVTVTDLTGGTITASPTVARPGTTITLTITPDTGKQLKADSLKYNDVNITGTTFTMPAEDVVITAVFEDIPVVLGSIAVTTPPAKTTYTVGDALDLTGLVITATYSDETSGVVTGYTTDPADGTVLNTEGTVTVTVSYTEGEITKTTTFDVTVTAAGAGE